MKPKHIPLRTCVECQQVRAKRELVRVVHTPEGSIAIDERGKSPGRGAYVCRNKPCLEGAITHQRLAHALKTTLTPVDVQQLLQYGEAWPDRDAQVDGKANQSSSAEGVSDNLHG